MAKRIALVSVLALVLPGIAWWWLALRAPATPEVGRTAPAFKLNGLSGSDVSLDVYRGRPVIVNFWATWCVPCKEEMPALQAQLAASQDLVILGVDEVESAVVVKPFVQQLGINFPIALDQDGSLMDQYNVIGMPTSFFVDRSGTLRAIYRGALTPDDLQLNLAVIEG